MDPTLFTQGLTRFIESSPVIVAVISFFAWMVWKTWREERRELLAELREERQARATSHHEIVAIAERSTEAIHAVRDAVSQLRQALDVRRG